MLNKNLNKKEKQEMDKRTVYLPSRASYQTRKPSFKEVMKRHFIKTPIACYVVRAVPVAVVSIAWMVG